MGIFIYLHAFKKSSRWGALSGVSTMGNSALTNSFSNKLIYIYKFINQ